MQNATSYREIAAYEDANRQQNIEKLKAIAARPDITPTQRTRIEGMIKKLDDPLFYNRVTEKRTIGSNFFRGLTKGLVGDVALGTVDLLAAIGEVPAKGIDKVLGTSLSKPLEKARDSIAESQEILSQGLDAQGVEGALGRVTGVVGGGLVGGAGGEAKAFGGGVYGAASNLVLRRLSSLEGGIGTLARLGENGTWIQRAALNVISGLPIDFIQAYTLPESEQVKEANAKQERGEALTAEEESALDDYLSNQLKVLAMGVGGNAAGGLLIEGATKGTAKLASTVQKVAGGRQLSPGDLAGQAESMVTIANVAEQAKQAKRAASLAWNRGNRSIRRQMVTGLDDEVYDLAYKDLPNEIKHAAQLQFGGPDVDMNLVSQARRAADSKLNTLVQDTKNFVGRDAGEVEYLITQSFPEMGEAEVQQLAKGLVAGQPDAQVKWALRAHDSLTRPPSPAPTQAPTKPAQTPSAQPTQPAQGTEPAPSLLPEGIEGEGAERIKAALPKQIDSEIADLKARLDAAEQRAVHEERRANQNERLAMVDPLSGLGSKHAWEQARASIDADEGVSVIAIDVGNFKGINDALGHDVGDEEIRQIGQMIGDVVNHRGRSFRPGGDEFTIAVPDADAHAIGQELKRVYGQRPIGDTEFVTHLRIGIGKTFKEADEGLKVAQQAEKAAGHARARPIGGESADLEPAKPDIPEVKNPAPDNVKETGPSHAPDLVPGKPVSTVLYRGVTEGSRTEGPLFFTRDPKVASHFASDEFAGAQVTQQYVEVKNPAGPEDVKQALRDIGIDPEHQPALSDHIYESSGYLHFGTADALFSPKVVENLRSKGFDGFVGVDESLGEGIDPTIVVAFDKSQTKPLGVGIASTKGKDLAKLPARELTLSKNELRGQLESMAPDDPARADVAAEFKRIMDFEAKRDGGHGVTLYTHPSISGGLIGFMAGFALPADDDEQRIKNAVLFGAVGIGGGIYAARRWGPAARRTKPNLPPWEENISKKVVSGMDLHKPPTPFMMRLRKLYNFFARRSGAIEASTAALGGKNLPVQRNPGKLAAIFGRWQAQTESFLLDQPSMIDKAGNIRWLNALPMQKIVNMVNGDTDRLGYLMASARTLELAQEGKRTGIDLLDARMTFVKAGVEYHQAMGEARKFNAALVDVADDASLVADRAKMSDVFYAPLNRIFGGAPGHAPAKQTITSKVKTSLGVPNPIKAQKGGTQLILNPAEATVGNVPRILRASELNKIGIALADLLDAADPKIAKQIGERLHGSKLKDVPGYGVKIQQLQSEMNALGSNITEQEAAKIVATFSNEALNLQDDILRIHRNGKLEQWRLNEEVAKAFRSLNPDELHSLVKFLGLPTHAARFGITNNPIFVARQAFRDNWQAWLNTQYGFIPFVDQARGWFHIVTRSKQYREYLAGGGGYGALAEQRFARGITALADVKRAPTKNELDKAIKEIKELRPLQAYQTLINPVIEAARVGEFLRARGAGKSTLEAVFAAKHVTGNFQQIGTGMRAANHLTLFLNPAIQSLDASARSFMRNPIKYLTKAFVGVALPSWYFWNKYQDDDELNELRQTETGRRYWFTRTPDGSIVKIPKPIFDGQIFGSTVETVLDRQKRDNNASAELTRESIMNDIAVNLLPQIGAIPVSLWANKDLGTGAPIIPPSLVDVDPKYQANPNTTLAARVIGEKTHTSPAQIDYAVRSTFGTLGANMVRIVSSAVEYQRHGYVPPKEEMPFLDEIFARYPSLNTGSVREFYRNAERVHEAASTLGHAAKYDPLNVGSYVTSNIDNVALIDQYQKAREDLAELRASINLIRSLPVEQVPAKDKQLYIDALLRAMITEAKQVNAATDAVRRNIKPQDIQK